MNEEVSLLNSRSLSQFSSLSIPARWLFTKQRRENSAPLLTNATRPSPKSGEQKKVRPSFYLAASCLALGVSGFLLLPPAAHSDEQTEKLFAHGWTISESHPCSEMEPGSFFEADSDQVAIEGYFSTTGLILISGSTLPEPPYQCRKIKQPSFIQEIQ